MEQLHRIIIRLAKAHRRAVHGEFCKVGLSEGQPKILDFLIENDGCIQRDIADNCRIEPATVSSILTIMEKKELIYRNQNPSNRRILNVFLTNKGIEAQKQVEKIFCDLDEICFKGFTEEEKIEAIKLLLRIKDNITGKDN
jgi:DNA-binding MarR family transcriptional regulator